MIGIAFLFLLLLVGTWAYTDVLAEAARGMAGNLPARGALLVALFGGAVIGGWTAGLFKPYADAPRRHRPLPGRRDA